jgi:hypothetical protein
VLAAKGIVHDDVLLLATMKFCINRSSHSRAIELLEVASADIPLVIICRVDVGRIKVVEAEQRGVRQ